MIYATILIAVLIVCSTVIYPFMESLSRSIEVYLGAKVEKQGEDIIELTLLCNEMRDKIAALEEEVRKG